VPTLLGHALIASTHCWRGRGICKRRKLWHRLVMLCLRALTFIAVVVFAATTGAVAGGRIRLAVQKTGTLAWELDVIKTHGLDRKLDLEIIPVELASPEAGKVALKGGSADLILSDWLWVARERSLGDALVFYPASSTLGAVMVPKASAIREIADLRRRKLAVAGGPIDKSWLLLQALARRDGIDLKSEATIVYGAPPLLSEKALQGETDATLTYWNFCAELESKGMRRAIPMETVMQGLGAKAAVAVIGYVFDNGFAQRNRAAVDRFLDAVRQAKDVLATSDAEWRRLAPRIRVTDDATLAIYRTRYAEGIPRRPIAAEEEDARALFRVLAGINGGEFTGAAGELPPGTFYRPAAE